MSEWSSWLGIIAYSISAGLGVIWVGISAANWLVRRSLCTVVLGLGAACWSIFFVALVIISSDKLPAFSGPSVALAIRVSAAVGAVSFFSFTLLYLRQKYKQIGC